MERELLILQNELPRSHGQWRQMVAKQIVFVESCLTDEQLGAFILEHPEFYPDAFV